MKIATEDERLENWSKTSRLVQQVVKIGFTKLRLYLVDEEVVCGDYVGIESLPRFIETTGRWGHSMTVTIQPENSPYAVTIDVEDIISIEGVR